jgi:hypothetical protein
MNENNTNLSFEAKVELAAVMFDLDCGLSMFEIDNHGVLSSNPTSRFKVNHTLKLERTRRHCRAEIELSAITRALIAA